MTITVTDLNLRERTHVEMFDTWQCWVWDGWRNDAGYGYVRVDGKDRPAHRVMFEIMNGPVPEGLEIGHVCNNRACIRPSHLEAVTHAENQRRASQRQTKCRRAGHDWTDPNNVRVRKNGRRWCAECDRIDQRERYRRRKGGSS